MAKLNWDKSGDRYFETGVDRGVLYPLTGSGVAWNGLVSVSENPSGGEATPYYSDGIKYLNASGTEEFGGTIEAYTYPDQFAECDGTASFNGVSVHQQPRKAFGLSYRTLIGNDLDGTSHAYKIHLIYNALAAPSQIDYGTVDDNPEALTFSWEFTTTPVQPPMSVASPLAGPAVGAMALDTSGMTPVSHLTVDSRKAKSDVLKEFENILYGTSSKAPRLPTLSEVLNLFEDWAAFGIDHDEVTGMSPIDVKGYSDLSGSFDEGLFKADKNTRLKSTSTPGLYSLD